MIAESYGHASHYLVAESCSHKAQEGAIENEHLPRTNRDIKASLFDCEITGILPLVHIKHPFFGNRLVSPPYFDRAGILSQDGASAEALLTKSIELAERLKATQIELRQFHPLSCLGIEEEAGGHEETSLQKIKAGGWKVFPSGEKVRMVLALPDTPERLMMSFPAKLRSQIRRPLKDGLGVRMGGAQLIDDFYKVFSENMRDLGSPVHSRSFILEVVRQNSGAACLFVVYGDHTPMACSLVIGYKGTLFNPWASSLRRYKQAAPNMLLYWAMLEYGCLNGYQRFDFGRSTPGEGTYKFKQQWGAAPEPLHWYVLSNRNSEMTGRLADKESMSKAIQYWKKLPVSVTTLLGPAIRKYISL